MPDGTTLSEVKISELPVASQANASDMLEASQNDGTKLTSRSITVDQIATRIRGNWNVNAEAFLENPTSANLATLMIDETGAAGALVFSSAPTLTNPALHGGTWDQGVLSNTTLNAGTITGSSINGTWGGNVSFSGAVQVVTQAQGATPTTLAASLGFVQAAIAAIPGYSPPTYTQGSILFAGASGAPMENNAQFFWSNTPARLGIGTNAPQTSLDIATPASGVAIYAQVRNGSDNIAIGCFPGANGFVGTLSNSPWELVSNSVARWQVQAAGHFAAWVDNTYDIGMPASQRPRNLFLGGGITASGGSFGGTVFAENATAISAGGTVGRGVMLSSTANFGVIFGSGAPTAVAARGSLYLRSDGAPYYNTDGTGTGWVAIGTGGGVSISDTAPVAPTAGQLWWKSDTGILYIFYNDGNSTQWVPATPAVQPAAGTLTLYSEQKCVGGETQMNVTIPANAKRIELEIAYASAAGDPTLALQTVESGVVNATNNHAGQQLYATGTTVAGAAVGAGTSWNIGGSATAEYSIKFMPRVTGTWSGLMHEQLITTAAARYVQVWSMTGGASPATTTGFRVTLGSSSFQANSFMRAYVVV